MFSGEIESYRLVITVAKHLGEFSESVAGNDEGVIELFFERSEQAIKELDGKYGKVFHSLSFKILNNHQDAEECVNDSYLGTWNAIPPAKPNPLFAFVCKIVRNVSLKRYEKNTAAKRNSNYDIAMDELEDCLASPNTVEKELSDRELTEIIGSFLNSLSAENRVIFLRRYWYFDSVKAIARRYGFGQSKVKMMLHRTRETLRDYLAKEGIFV